MKLCFLTHAFPPAQTAAASYSKNFVKELLSNGFEVVVITTTRNNETSAVEKSGDLTVYRINLGLPIFSDFLEFMTKVSSIVGKVYEKESFDLTHSEHLYPAVYSGIFAKKHKIPHVVTIEGVSNVSPYSKMLFQLHKFLLPKISYDALVSWGRFVLENYFLKWGVDKSKCSVIPGAVDINEFSPAVSGSEIKKKLVNREKLIFTAKPMYLTNALGISLIIKAMKIVSNENKNCKLIVGGTGRMLNRLVSLTKDLKLTEQVKFIGWVPQNKMPNYYKAADIIVDSFVFSHPGSVTALESLSSGTPNVLTEIECLPGEVNVPTKDIAVLSKPSDPESIADGILKLLNDVELGNKVGKNARKFIEKEFSVEKVTQSYMKLYEELI